MPTSNRYLNRGRISERRFRAFLRLFRLDLTATQIAAVSRLNRNTVNRLIRLLRERMARICERQARLAGVIEADESYFGLQRTRSKRGRGCGGKTIVFGLPKRGESVFTRIVPNCSRAALQAVIRGRVEVASVIHTDGWSGYDGLVDLGFEKHFRVRHGENEFAREGRHSNGIESFWAFAKKRPAKFHGVRERHFYLHLKECEFRFNHRHQDLYREWLVLLRKTPLS
ncbi:MAG: IS1595 family transposase [Planctomycetota bacterium]